MNRVEMVEQDYLKKSVPQFEVGNQVKVHLKVKEGEKSRIQIFEGIVIRKRGRNTGATFTVLKDAGGELVEKVFPLHSPNVEKVLVVRKTTAHRAKLYYLKNKGR